MSDIPFTIVQLPQHLLEDIVNRLEDAVHLARVKCVCKSFRNAANRVWSLQIICKEEYYASFRDEDPIFEFPAFLRPARRGAKGRLNSSKATNDSALSIQKTENDVTPVVSLPTTQNSTDTRSDVAQEHQSDNGSNKHPPQQEKADEDRTVDAPVPEVPPSIDVKRPSQCQEEDQSDVKFCNQQPQSSQNGSNQALQNTSRNFLTYKEDQQETLRDENVKEVPPFRNTKKWKLQREFSVGDFSLHVGEASTSVMKEEPGTNKGHVQETLRDHNGNFLDGRHRKKPKLEGEFHVVDFEVREASMSVRKEEEECDTHKGHMQETLMDVNGSFSHGHNKKAKLEGEFCVGDLQSGEVSTSMRKEVLVDTCKGHLQESLRDDNGNFGDGRNKKPKVEGEFCVEDLEDGENFVTSKEPINFREIVTTILRDMECVAQLRLEIEPKLQSKVVPESERRLTDHWLTAPLFVKRWIPSIQSTIQHLCIVDYAQQAIMRQSNFLEIVSKTCFVLKTLDLRNMFLGMGGCRDMPCLTSFTLRSVKVQGDALQQINARMQNLQTLALLQVHGVQEGHLTFPELKVLCLGLSSKAKLVKVELPKLVKLQLKMLCPEALHVYVPTLKFVAFNLEIPNCSLVGFDKLQNLRELLYGSSNFTTLSKLVQRNVLLDKVFLDIPCMKIDQDGKWLGVSKEVLLDVPPFETLQSECQNLQVLNVGPGLWHSMEIAPYSSLVGVRAWPPITRLILHMIPHTLATSVAVLLLFITVMHKLQVLEVKVHTNSEVDYDSFIDAIKSHVAHLKFRHGKWTKSLDFSCFSF